MASSQVETFVWPICLREAIKSRNYPYLNQYLADESNIYAREIDGLTPLQIAIQENDVEMVQYFLDHKADPNQSYLYGDWECCSPLDYALATKSHKIAILLIEYGADIYARSHIQVPAIFMAVTHNQVRVVRYLMAHGVDPDMIYSDEYSLLSIALLKGNVRVLRCILNHKPKLDLRQNQQSIVKMILLSNARTSKRLVSMLYRYGFNLQYSDIRPELIRKSIEKGHRPAVENLLTLGISPNFGIITDQKTKKTTSLLHIAVEAKEIKIVKLLLKYGANVHLRDPTGKTPILIAAAQNNLGMIRILLRSGANVRDTNACGWSVLHYAIMDDIKRREDLYKDLKVLMNRNKTKIIRFLIYKGADLNTKTHFGSSPLHLAAEIGDPEVIQILLDHGARINEVTSSDNKTPLDIARDEVDLQVVIRSFVGQLIWRIVNKRKLCTLILLQCHVYRLHQLGLPVCPKDIQTINEEQKWPLDIYIKNKINVEVDYVKNTKIGDSYVTLWRFLMRTDTEVAKYVNNNDFLTSLKNMLRFPNEFPRCAQLIRNKLTIALKKKELNRVTLKLLNFIFAEKDLPPLLNECVEHIMNCFTEKDKTILVNGFVK